MCHYLHGKRVGGFVGGPWAGRLARYSKMTRRRMCCHLQAVRNVGVHGHPFGTVYFDDGTQDVQLFTR